MCLLQKIPAPTLPAAHRIAVVSQWDVKDVGLWLAQLGLPDLQTEFRKHAIDGQELLHLTHETLTNVLGVGRYPVRSYAAADQRQTLLAYSRVEQAAVH